MVICKFCKEEIGSRRNCGGYHWQCRDFQITNLGGSLAYDMFMTLYGHYEPDMDKAELYEETPEGYHIEAIK